MRAAFGGVRLRAAIGTVIVLLLSLGTLATLGSRSVGAALEERLIAEATAANDQVSAALLAGTEPGLASWRPTVTLSWRVSSAGTVTGGRFDIATNEGILPAPRWDADEYSIDRSDAHSSVAVERVTATSTGQSATVTTFADAPDVLDTWSSLNLGVVPFIALFTVILVWWVVGRALGPVERMRLAASRVGTDDDISTRLPEGSGDDEISALAATLNAMLDRIEQASGRQRAFISDAGHELRSPLTILTTLLGTPGPIDDRSRAALIEACRRLEALVDDLFTLARLDEWGLADSVDVDVDALCDSVADSIAAQHPELTVVVDADPARMRGDADALERVLTNLCRNAARHTRTKIVLTCRQRGDQIILDVSDDGDGVPPADRTRIFERFARLDESRSRDAGGAGLGLAIVARTIESHGGTIDARSNSDGGATFHIEVPVHGRR